jgi:hypothetical protein
MTARLRRPPAIVFDRVQELQGRLRVNLTFRCGIFVYNYTTHFFSQI